MGCVESSSSKLTTLLAVLAAWIQYDHCVCCSIFGSVLGGNLNFTSRWLTLTGGLEAEGLEAPSQRGGVDDIDTVLALAPSVKSDSDDQKHNCHHPCSKA